MDHPRLAIEEVRRQIYPHKLVRAGRHIHIWAHNPDFSSLAFTRSAHRVLLSTDNLNQALAEYPWHTIYKDSFAITLDAHHIKPAPCADIIFNALEQHGISPKVNLKNAGTEIHIVQNLDQYFITIPVYTNTQNFQSRRSHLRPVNHPTSLHPKLARAAINLIGIHKGSIVDPFCGAGGILLESALLGYATTGIDLDGTMLASARKNLKAYNVQAQLIKGNALTYHIVSDAIVTDIPYGKSSRISHNINELMRQFLKHIVGLTKIAVIITPNSVTLPDSQWHCEFSYDVYIHRSLTRRIHLLIPKKI